MTGAWNAAELQAYANDQPAWPPTPQTWRKKFAYDGDNTIPYSIGRITQMSANNGGAGAGDVSEALRYDIFGNTLSSALSVGGFASGATQPVQYDYDSLGNIRSIVYPAASDGTQLKVFYQLNPLNQITAIAGTSDFATPIATFAYDAAGNPSQSTTGLANGGSVQRTYQFNSPNWLTDIRDQAQGNTTLFHESLCVHRRRLSERSLLRRDDRGLVPSDSGGVAPEQYQFLYSYHSVGQVLNAENPQVPGRNLGVSQPVTHDANGNFVQLAAGGTPFRYAYNPGLQQVSQVTNQATNASVAQYQYDGNGNAKHSTTVPQGSPLLTT